MMTVVRAYRFALDATPTQERVLLSHCGAARVAHNWGLARVKANLNQRAAERTYDIPDDQLTPAMSWSMYSLRKEWNRVKGEIAPWWADNAKESYASGLNHLAQALRNWASSRKGTRAGRPMGFPRFKSKRRSNLSCRFTAGAMRVEADRQHVILPTIGRLKVHESTRKLARRIEAGTARIMSATIRRQGGRWYVSFTCEVQRAKRTPSRPHSVVAVDLGIKHLAVLSTGELVLNPHHLIDASRRLRRLNRALSRKIGPYDSLTSRRREQSKRWQVAAHRLGRAHRRVAELRRDGIHKLTTRLATENGTVVVEDLNVVGMKRNRYLARRISDAGFREIRRQLAYKTEWNGGRLIVADRWYPSSKTCSGCGAVKAKLALKERTYICETCGMILDRDLNAARNLAGLAATVAGSGPETINGRGADRKTPLAGQVAVKRQPGTATAGKTGTVPPQGGAPRRALIGAR